MNFNIKLKNNFEELDNLRIFLEELAISLKFSDDLNLKVNLIFEELVTNIIKYGYDDEIEHEIDLSISNENSKLICFVIDDGHEFNPFDMPEPDVNVSVEEREIGGLGILLIKNLSDYFAYERILNKNKVTIEFNL